MSEEKQYTREELENDLDDKQKQFCDEYVVDWAKARAYMRAYPDSSYEAAAVSANRLLKNAKIKQYIEFIKNELERLSGVSKLRNIQELAKIAYFGIEHIHNDWIELTDWEEIKRENPNVLAAVESIDTKTEERHINGDGTQPDTDIEIKYVKIKLYPKITAIQEINKMMGYNSTEKIDITSLGKSITGINYVTPNGNND